MTSRDEILAAMRRLTIETGVLPSMDDVARAAGLSKSGLIHHFPTRVALVDGLIGQAIAEVDAGMVAAAAVGRAAHTWLRLSVPDDGELELFRAMAVALKGVGFAQPGPAQPGSALPGSALPGSALPGSALPGPAGSHATRAGLAQSGSVQSMPTAASVLVAAAIARWDALLTVELGDATAALIVRLIGDGLFLNALSGTATSARDIDAIERRLLERAR